MPLTQMQIIQSLGDAMSWFERELGWGVPVTELRHLNGRIGELYAALITNGQMATDVNQHGYDVVADSGERISVKTTGMIPGRGHVSFNPNTLGLVDRVIILRINIDEMQIETLFNDRIEVATQLMSESNATGKRTISLSKFSTQPARSDIRTVSTAQSGNYRIEALENGSIQVFHDGELMSPAKPHLRKIASRLGLDILNSNGNPFNTRQLGSVIISALENERDDQTRPDSSCQAE